jgi:hypothetical protein
MREACGVCAWSVSDQQPTICMYTKITHAQPATENRPDKAMVLIMMMITVIVMMKMMLIMVMVRSPTL